MKSISNWKSDLPDTVNALSNGNQNRADANGSITAVRELTYRLLLEVLAITDVQTLRLEDGVDFYGAVSRFEIDLIKHALFLTAGHQGRAARLLNLKVTTLHAKIKHYKIGPNGFANGYPLVETGEIETRPHV